MKKKRNDSGKSKLMLGIITVLCAVLIVLSFTTDMMSGPLRYVTGVITPIQSGMNAIGTWISEKGEYLFNTTDLRSENAELKKKVEELTAENTSLLQNQDEFERLKDLLELKEEYEDYPTVAARIIAKDSGNWFNVFTINKGSNDGIKVDMNVIASGGLVGIVTSVGPNWATVRAIIDDYSNVSAEITSTSDNCIIAGNLKLIDEGKISLVKLTDADDKVTVGDKVVTSEISNRFLPGILIGYVSEIETDSNNLTKSGSITPVVDFRHLHEVLVITILKNTDEAQEDIRSQAQTETEMTVETDTQEGSSENGKDSDAETEGGEE
ncbi:MAG: rod shape-determining protein MreC [Hominisplanchenecus sp.]